jgi:N-sulfoglucosamine sulfohydrolase
MKPNILYIHSHDTGRYIQPFGYAVPTPRLQALAEEGVLFRNNHCICPTCSPSRSALLTGTYPHENGMIGLAHRGFSLRDYGEHLVHTLKPAGYTTALSGVQHVASSRGAKAMGHEEPWQLIGYDEWLGDDESPESAAAEWIASRGSNDAPFFLSVGFMQTHRVFPELDESDPEDPRYTVPPAPLPDTPETRKDMARYTKMARELDRRMGVVIDALKSAGVYENTLIVATTDHGIAFPRMKCNLEDSGTGTFLIMRAGSAIADGAFSGGQVVDAMTTHLDIFPTLMEVLGIAPPPRLRGRSVLPLLGVKGRAPALNPAAPDALHEAIFGEVTFHGSYEPMRSIRTARFKYIRRYDGRVQPVLPNVDNGESKSYWMEQGWRSRRPVEEALYDLAFDPNEAGNLAGDPEYAEILDEMRRRLARHLEETADPIRSGVILPPPGVVINWPDGDDAKSLGFTIEP